MLAYFAFIAVGVVLLLDLLPIVESGIFANIAYALAFIVVGACSFSFMSSKFRGRKKGLPWLIIWIIAAVLVTIVFIVPLFPRS